MRIFRTALLLNELRPMKLRWATENVQPENGGPSELIQLHVKLNAAREPSVKRVVFDH